MTMRCKNGEAHTHENVAQARACWLGGPASPAATLAQPVAEAVATLATYPETEYPIGHVHVADGRYAVTLAGEDTLRFFKVANGWKPGVVFVDEQAGPDTFPIKSRTRRVAILATIAADTDALARYGRELGTCGMCGLPLTDPTSRALGIGPVCRTK
jgi:hypothetical protein